MNLPHKSYSKQQKESLSDMPANRVDAWAMTESARRMREAMAEPIDKDKYRAVLRLNWRMWTIIQAELTHEECPLPEDLRHNLLSLSNFVDKQSMQALGTLEAKDLEPLITINREISAGLNNVPAPEATEKE